MHFLDSIVAQDHFLAQVRTLGDVGVLFLTLFSVLIGVVISLALVLFLWGAVKYVGQAGNEEARKEGRKFMLWGIIALFVMVSVWGLINILVQTFGITETALPIDVVEL